MRIQAHDNRSAQGFSRRLGPLLRHILFLLVVLTICLYIMKNVEEIRHYSFNLEWGALIASFLLLFISYLIMLVIWQKLSMSFGLHVPVLRAAKALYLSHLGKYVPGKITILLIRLEAYHGYSRTTVAVATFVEYFCMLASTSFFILLMVIAANEILPLSIRWTAAVGVVVFLGFLWPPVMKWFINLALKLARQTPLTEFPDYALLLRYAAASIVPVIGQGLAFYFILAAFIPVDFTFFPFIAGSYFAATLIGLAAVFTPSGIGVKEGILFIILASILPKPIVIVATIFFRLMIVAVELILAGIFSLFDGIFTHHPSAP